MPRSAKLVELSCQEEQLGVRDDPIPGPFRSERGSTLGGGAWLAPILCMRPRGCQCCARGSRRAGRILPRGPGQNGGMMHPAVQRALDAIARQLELVRLDFPGLPQRQQMQIARSRCGHEIAAANVALDLKPPLRPPAGAGRAR
jgi:hypothetical protein